MYMCITACICSASWCVMLIPLRADSLPGMYYVTPLKACAQKELYTPCWTGNYSFRYMHTCTPLCCTRTCNCAPQLTVSAGALSRTISWGLSCQLLLARPRGQHLLLGFGCIGLQCIQVNNSAAATQKSQQILLWQHIGLQGLRHLNGEASDERLQLVAAGSLCQHT
jgi:hypothetical protein